MFIYYAASKHFETERNIMMNSPNNPTKTELANKPKNIEKLHISLWTATQDSQWKKKQVSAFLDSTKLQIKTNIYKKNEIKTFI